MVIRFYLATVYKISMRCVSQTPFDGRYMCLVIDVWASAFVWDHLRRGCFWQLPKVTKLTPRGKGLEGLTSRLLVKPLSSVHGNRQTLLSWQVSSRCAISFTEVVRLPRSVDDSGWCIGCYQKIMHRIPAGNWKHAHAASIQRDLLVSR